MKTMNDLYFKQKAIWAANNEKYFGITPISDYSSADEVNAELAVSAKRFWNEGTNELKKILEGGKVRDIDRMIPKSYRLYYNDAVEQIQLLAEFLLPEDYRHSQLSISRAREAGFEKPLTRVIKLADLPCPTDLCWNINGSDYVLRVDARPNYDLIQRNDEFTWSQQNNWKYIVDPETKEGTFQSRNKRLNIWETLSNENKFFLSEIFGQQVTEDNFEQALLSMPIYDKFSAAYFSYDYVNNVFNLIKRSNRFANPLKYIPVSINVSKMIISQRIYQKSNNALGEDSGNSVIISNNTIFSLEMGRTIVYNSQFNMSFNFSDTAKIFDAFKTSTNKAAGRTRLLLDNIQADNGILWFEKPDGTVVSQYKAIFDDTIEVKENLSVISNSSFNSNNDPKRIMMTAKLRAQSVPIVGEEDAFSHDIKARIVFGDFEGFNFGDAIVISRSFARKLTSIITGSRSFFNIKNYNYINEKYDIGDEISYEDLQYVSGSKADKNLRRIVLKGLTETNLYFEAERPFGVGDKLTNFHGSKGIACVILEDDEMPYLENDLGPNMKKGYFEVIASGLSVFRRKSLGQIFEAYALATGNDDINNATDAIEKYGDDMERYGRESVVSFRGTKTIKPVGLNKFIRLNHDAVSKQSIAELKSNYGRMLKFSEMEQLALASIAKYSILNELDIRSVSKHANAFDQIQEMQKTNKDHYEVANNLRYFNIMRTMGVDFRVEGAGKDIEMGDLSRHIMSQMEMLNDENIDIFKNDKEII